MSKNQVYAIAAGGCLLALCAVGALLVGILYVAPRFASQLNPTPEVVEIASNSHPNADGNSLGDPQAPIRMEEFGDFQCPYCQRFHMETEPLLVEEYIKTGKLYFTYRSAGNWVSKNIGNGKTESQDAAMAAYCAGDQNKFWEMHDILFANVLGEDAGSFTDQRLDSLAEKVGLDMQAFDDCYYNRTYKDRVQQDYEDAIVLGVHGTPSFQVTYTANGQTKTTLIEGAQPIEAFRQILDEILKEVGG